MLKYNNTHIFTGYLKQLLSSFNLPMCKVYTHEFAKHLEATGKEDPRILKSFDGLSEERCSTRVNYLKNTEVYNYFWNTTTNESSWAKSPARSYNSDKVIPGLTRTLNSPGVSYDTKTHEYLGDYLRFLRDYYNINLMSLYNCFVDKIYNNIHFNFSLGPNRLKISFNSQDPNYRIYAIPVKLFATYTIALDSSQGVELFCGFYNTCLDITNKSDELAKRTYQKVNGTLFNQPFLYDKLHLNNWQEESDFLSIPGGTKVLRTDKYTRWDIINREKDLRLFIKVPASCQSTITILEGDYRTYNNSKYVPMQTNSAVEGEENKALFYSTNRCILNFNEAEVDLNSYDFKQISRLQLLAFNTGESYPFSDRLIEYLSGSAVTPIEEIPDNIKRAQRVMSQNHNYFKIEGLWENKMQNILYDYIMNSGPVEVITLGNDADHDPDNFGKKIQKPSEYQYKTKQKIVDNHNGYHRRLGHTNKSLLFDILGYVDKDTEKFYASWKKDSAGAKIDNTIQNVDIYNGLYDI